LQKYDKLAYFAKQKKFGAKCFKKSPDFRNLAVNSPIWQPWPDRLSGNQ